MDNKTLAGLLLGLVIGVGLVSAAVSTVPISGKQPLTANSNATIIVDGASELDWSQAWKNDTAVRVETGSGSLTMVGNGDTTATVAASNIEGGETALTNINASAAPMTINPDDKPAFTVGGDIETVSVPGDFAIDDGTVDFSYSGPDGTTSRVTISGVTPKTTMVAVDAANNTRLDTATADNLGKITFDSLDNSQHNVVLQSTEAPTLTDLTPNGGLSAKPTDISVNVSDDGFDRNESVTVNISLDGTQIDSDTVTSESTITTTIPSSGQLAGSHDITATATDSDGLTTSLSTTYLVPDELVIYNESAPTQQIDNAEVTVRFFKGDTVIERSTTNGSINLTGLPVSEDMTIVVSASNYTTRSSFIETIYEQQRVYALPSSTARAAIVFQLDDKTGNFPPGATSLRIQRSITRDRDGDGTNETEFETVAGGVFGASGEFATELIGDGRRYRLVVENDEGDRRELGDYTVTGDDLVQLPIGELQFSGGEQDAGVAFQGSLQSQDGQRYIDISYADPDAATSELTYTIYWSGNNTELLNRTVAGPVRTYSTNEPIPEGAPDDVTFEIEWEATRDGAESASGELFVGSVPKIAQALDIDPTVLNYLSMVGIVAITGLVVVFDDKLAAIVAVVMASALTLLGAVSIPPVGLAMGGGIAVLYNIGRVRGS